jgi:hypothetical protein
MWAVRTKARYLATFDDRYEAEEWCRTWRAVHGMRAWVSHTEN